MKFLITLFGLSIVTHLAFFGWPSQVVFDEVHNGKYISNYAYDSYYFDVHPPLGKIFTKIWGDIIDIPYDVDWSSIGNSLPWQVILLRLLPIAAGILFPIIIYFICQRLSFSPLISFCAGALIILENSLLVQTRFILFDGIMLLFGFSSILVYLIYIKKKRWWLIALSAALAVGAFGIKWTGFAYPLLICIAEIVRSRNTKASLKFLIHYVVVGVVLYLAIFVVHFAHLRHTGPGDVFMTDRFQKTIIGSEHYSDHVEPKKFFGKVIELNIRMFEANSNLSSTHSYSSTWLTWPLMIRPIFYWQGTPDDNGNEYIYLLGNPLIYWGGLLAIIYLIYRVVRKKYDKVLLFILGGFLVNYLPFMFIGRVMFLYHYEAALVFSILAICYWIDREVAPEKKKKTLTILLGLGLAVFLFFAPLTYGIHLSDAALQARMWIPTWR